LELSTANGKLTAIPFPPQILLDNPDIAFSRPFADLNGIELQSNLKNAGEFCTALKVKRSIRWSFGVPRSPDNRKTQNIFAAVRAADLKLDTYRPKKFPQSPNVWAGNSS
jgi:hypothetical protein